MFNKSNKQEKGQGLVEYALIIVLIAIVVIVAMQFLAPTVGNVFTNIGDTLTSVGSGGGSGDQQAQAPEPTEESGPDPDYVAWCNSLGFPYHMNSEGVCVKGN